jgi:hypothetical protein
MHRHIKLALISIAACQILDQCKFMKKGKEKYSLIFMHLLNFTCGHAVEYWLRHYATNRKVAGSIPDEVKF